MFLIHPVIQKLMMKTFFLTIPVPYQSITKNKKYHIGYKKEEISLFENHVRLKKLLCFNVNHE